MDQLPPSPGNDLQAELVALRAEIAELRKQVQSIQDIQSIAIREELGARSVLGLRRFGTLMYFITLPLSLAANIIRFVETIPKRISFGEMMYEASFTWVYLRGKEKNTFIRLKNFYPTYRYIREKMRRGSA